jgi:quinol monooxygenase YgiN
MTVHVVARIVAQRGKEKDLESVLRELVAPTRKEKGCVSYRLLVNPKDAADFTLVEEWASDAAIDQHVGTPHLQAALAKAGPLLGAAPDIRRYREV